MSHARTLHRAPDGGAVRVAVCFVIPVRHPANAPDWGKLRARLAQTVASVAAQNSPSWRGILVANAEADLPPLPARFEVVRVSFPPNPAFNPEGQSRQAFHAAVRWDKGRRVLAGVLAAEGAARVMTVDDDDFVSRRLVAFLEEQAADVGWRVDEGWLWTEGGRLLYRHPDFSSACGTSLVIPRARLPLPTSVDTADPADVSELFGSHIEVKARLHVLGTALRPLPFPAAVYRVGHPGNHSRAKSVLRTHLVNRRVLMSPGRMVDGLGRLRLVGPRQREEFGLP